MAGTYAKYAPASSSGGGGGGGVSIVGTFSATAISNGASIASDTITFGPADGTTPGMISTGAQTIAGAKTFSSLPAITAGGDVLLSGGTNTNLKRANSAVKITDADTYLSRPGIDFYGGPSGLLLAELDDSQFIISTNMNFYPDATYDIGGAYRPRALSISGTFTTPGFNRSGVFCGTSLQYVTSGSNFTIDNGVSTVIVDPGSTTAAQTITMPAAALDGQLLFIAFGTNGVTALTIAANSGQTVVGAPTTGLAASPASFVYRNSNTTWYRVG